MLFSKLNYPCKTVSTQGVDTVCTYSAFVDLKNLCVCTMRHQVTPKLDPIFVFISTFIHSAFAELTETLNEMLTHPVFIPVFVTAL